MPRTLTQRDISAIITAVGKQATGQANLGTLALSDFVSVGETLLSSGTENVYNALSLVAGRTLAAVRPYKAKLGMINALDSGIYSHRLRKISYYSRDPVAAGDWNTQLFTNLNDGFTAGENDAGSGAQSTKSQWEQRQAYPLELWFGGSSVWQEGLTRYKYQVQQAFRSEADFAAFWAGVMTEKGNDIEQQKESFRRMTLLNFIAGIYDLGGTRAVNLTAAYNTRFGTSYTSAQLRGTYLKSFLEFMTATIKTYSDRMTIRSANFHWSPTKQDAAGNALTLLRHTPKDKQRLFLYAPLFREAEAMVLPEIFNPNYLNQNAYEGVDFWQNFDADGTDNAAINVTPAIPDTTTPTAQTTGANVSLSYVVGVLFDEDACMTDFQLDDAETTPIEARKRYMTTWWSFARNAINDFTENGVVFYMAD